MLIADRYEIDDLPLGRGGMGAVHKGRDLRLDRRVAVKLLRLPGSDDEVSQRFAREARIVAKLEHPGVPVLYDFGTYEQRLFQVMQFVDGVTVADLVGEFGPLPEAWAANIAAQTAAVLAAAHERGICHRDLKPTNLMLCPDGSRNYVVNIQRAAGVIAGAHGRRTRGCLVQPAGRSIGRMPRCLLIIVQGLHPTSNLLRSTQDGYFQLITS